MSAGSNDPAVAMRGVLTLLAVTGVFVRPATR